MIKKFDYQLDIDNLEVFPKEIWSDPYVVFHGTSTFHSESIEQCGWLKKYTPYDIEDVTELIKILKLSHIKPFDRAKVCDLTTANTLENYIKAKEVDKFRISFSYLSSQCVLFSTGNSKGGQTLGTVRDAKKIIETAITANPFLQNVLTKQIYRLYDLADEIERASGVVYAIKLPKDLEDITEENGVILSNISIPNKLIVGKVIIPNDIDLNFLDRAILYKKNKAKLLQLGHLGLILGRRMYSGV